MANNLHNSLTFNYKQILIEEIALHGLEGIGFDPLWKYVEKRISATVTDKMKARFWSFLHTSDSLTFYKAPKPLTPSMELQDRFTIVDEHSGHLMDPPDYLDGPYEYCPVKGNYGSCSNYKTRKEIPKNKLAELASYESMLTEYGATLILVATLEERWRALSPHVPASVMSQLTPIHYCLLELVGKSRENGQLTVGKTNIVKIVKEPKFLFYNRKHLEKLDLIRVLCVTIKHNGRGIKAILLRLKRFHKPSILSLPKAGTLHNVSQYLLQQPNYCEKTDVIITKALMTQQNSKRLQKTINAFKFDERFVQLESSNKNGKKTNVTVKRRFISLDSKSDESSQSEDEDHIPLESQYKVGVDLLRQAYERFLDAGLKGLTQIEISQLLGVEFYTSRTICRLFKARHIIREYLEDRGKQRTARYFAVAAATGEMDQKYQEEMNKLLEYMKKTKAEKQRLSTVQRPPEDEDDIPLKKIKLESSDSNQKTTCTDNEVTEIKILDGLENFNVESLLSSKKNPTLRQLKFANGLLKVTRERQAVAGYQNLSSLVSKETGEPPMDTKALKIFVQKLITDGQLKLMKIKWPGFQQKYSILICAPHLECTDPVIKTKQREISIRAFTAKKVKRDKNIEPIQRPPSQYAYPRYMKIQLLHEFLVKLIYFDGVKIEGYLPEGFASLVNIIPEITVEFGIGNISNVAVSDISHLKIDQDVLKLRLRDAPEELYQTLLQSKSLQNSIRINLKVLAMLGLIQLVNQPTSQTSDHNSTLSSYVFYVNKQAKILDTTGTWPRKIDDQRTLEKMFYFESFSDVKTYWNEVYEISTHTTVVHPYRGRKTLTPPVRQMHEVQENDKGEIFGDGSGPCGFDSCFFMEQSRFWRVFYIRVIKNKPLKKTTLKNKVSIVKEKKPKKKKEGRIRKRETKPQVQIQQAQIHQSVIRRRRRNTGIVKWSKWEDTILMMCKVAVTILSPDAQPGCLKIRNTAAKDLLHPLDPKKISSVCHRRAEAIEADFALQHEKECLINELRRRRHQILKYEGLLKKLKVRHSMNMTKFLNEARIPMLELLWLINQLVKNRSSIPNMPCIATDIEDFHKKYTVSTSSANKPCNNYKTDGDSVLDVTLIKESIILSLMSHLGSKPTTDEAKTMYSFFVEFPEPTLRVALEQLRKCGAVACKDKILNNHLHRFNAQDMVQSSYKISAAYQRRWIARLNTDFPDIISKVLETQEPEASVKASPEINCVLCEFQSYGILEIISVTVPVITGSSGSIIQEQQLNAIDIESSFKLKSGIVGWKKLSDINQLSNNFDNIRCDDLFTAVLRNSIFPIVSDMVKDEQDAIVNHLKKSGERGVLLNELTERFDDDPTIIKKLEELESNKVISRVGFYENRIVLTEFAKSWAIKTGDKHMIPMPWVTLDSKIRTEIFFKWSSVIMNRVFEQPGCSVAYLSNALEMLTTRAVQEICVFLKACECVNLKVLRIPEIDLFSKDGPAEFCEYNHYEAPENICVFPKKDSLTKYAYIRQKLLSCDKKEA